MMMRAGGGTTSRNQRCISALLLLLLSMSSTCSAHMLWQQGGFIPEFAFVFGLEARDMFPPANMRGKKSWARPFPACLQHRGAYPIPTLPVYPRQGCRAYAHGPGIMPLQLCAPGKSEFAPTGGLNFKYESEHGEHGREQTVDTRARIWRNNQMAWSPLQSPVIVVQAVMLFHQKSAASLSSTCQRALAPDALEDSAQLQSALDTIGALIDKETAMRQEIASCVQILFDTSPLKGTGTLAIEQTSPITKSLGM